MVRKHEPALPRGGAPRPPDAQSSPTPVKPTPRLCSLKQAAGIRLYSSSALRNLKCEFRGSKHLHFAENDGLQPTSSSPRKLRSICFPPFEFFFFLLPKIAASIRLPQVPLTPYGSFGSRSLTHALPRARIPILAGVREEADPSGTDGPSSEGRDRLPGPCS